MNGDFALRLLMGHLIGEYLFQTNWMALNKKESLKAAAIHCVVYTLCISALVFPELIAVRTYWDIFLWLWLVFISHAILDASHLVDWWLDKIGSRSYRSAEIYCRNTADPLKQSYMVAYTALVQTVADNTLHLISLYVIVKALEIV